MDTLKGSDDRVYAKESWYSTTIRKKTPCGNIYVTGNYDRVTGDLVQTQFHSSKDSPMCIPCWGEGASRLISLILKLGGTKISIVRELEYCYCGIKNGLTRPGDAVSCVDALAKAINALPKNINVKGKEDDGVINTEQ